LDGTDRICDKLAVPAASRTTNRAHIGNVSIDDDPDRGAVHRGAVNARGLNVDFSRLIQEFEGVRLEGQGHA
jgi:hypothetical protein